LPREQASMRFWLLLEFYDVSLIVNPHRRKFAQQIRPREAIKLDFSSLKGSRNGFIAAREAEVLTVAFEGQVAA
ncbi:MAG TPA: hypothetical protein VHM93_08420, partial [Candidatus Acidoferrum sp.]|nr:hypothetical protein [Candidatus Acidoferrum sp.]